MRVITPDNFKKGLWKNGRGVSWDIASEPSRAGAELGWRLSLAEIAESGPFSLYGPVDRVFTLVSGGGLSLNVGGKTLTTPPRQPLAFPCDVKTSCAVSGGPCRALNLFTARGEWSAAARVIAISDVIEIALDGRACALFALQGESALASGGVAMSLGEGSAAVIGAGAQSVSAASRCGLLYAATLSRL
jgi:uncharacterized protein